MLELLYSPIVLILSSVSVIFTILYIREYVLRKKLQSEGEKVLEDYKEKGLETLHQSIQNSQNILSEAQLEGVKVVADVKYETSKLEEEYKKKLIDLINQSQQTISTSQSQLIQFMYDLQKRSDEFEIASKQAGEQKINQVFGNLESRLSDFLIQTEQKTISSIELELKAARNLVESYKNQQLKLIDENIIAMMEQTLNIVLAKKLSLKDQLELIYEALEKAKVEKFVV